MFTEPHLNTRGVARIRDSYANPRLGHNLVLIARRHATGALDENLELFSKRQLSAFRFCSRVILMKNGSRLV